MFSYLLSFVSYVSFFRVSFGNAKGNVVETFIYESVPTTEDDLNRYVVNFYINIIFIILSPSHQVVKIGICVVITI